MGFLLCGLASVGLGAPPADESGPLTLAQLRPGQELVFRGTYAEEADRPGLRFRRAYDLELRAFVLATPPAGVNLALLTVVQLPQAAPGGASVVGSARLVRARLDLQGRLTVAGAALEPIPLDGPPTLETGFFVALPNGRLGERGWDAAEAGRPPFTWRPTGRDVLNGQRCTKLAGIQQSDEWAGQVRSDRPADAVVWRRQETVWWLSAGYAGRVERVLERRTPGRPEPLSVARTRYDFASSTLYPDKTAADLRREVEQSLQFGEQLEALEAEADSAALQALAARAARHLEQREPTAYRAAVLAVQRRVAARLRGDAPPTPPKAETPAIVGALKEGQPAPDFAADDLVSRTPVRLSRWRGRPVFLVFYNPAAASAEPVLRFAQSAQIGFGTRVQVAALAVAGDPAAAVKQRADLGVTVPILAGTAAPAAYGTDQTPKFLILDRAGVVRQVTVGWGAEIGPALCGQVERCLKEE